MPFAFIGIPEALVLAAIVGVVLFARRLPDAGRFLGRRARETKDAVAETKDALEEGYDTGEPEIHEHDDQAATPVAPRPPDRSASRARRRAPGTRAP